MLLIAQFSIVNRAQRFELKVFQVEKLPIQLRRLRLNWYRHDVDLALGQHWRLKVKLKRPNGLFNPAGFDYEGWMFRHQIDATGYVRPDENNHLLGEHIVSVLPQWFRAISQHRLKPILEDYVQGGVIQALLFGDRSQFSKPFWQSLTLTGTSHLFVISGLHIGLIAGVFYFVTLWTLKLWVRFAGTGLSSSHNFYDWAIYASLIGAAIYSLLAGFSLPTQRAMLMLTVVLLVKLFRRNTSVWLCFWLAMAMVVTLDPLAFISAGFWLSFGAVAVLLFGFSGYTLQTGFLWKLFRPQWLVFIGLMPVLAVYFQLISLVSLLANVVAIPLVSLLIVPLVFIGGLISLVGGEDNWILAIADRFLSYLFVGLEQLAYSEYATVVVPAPELGVVCLGIVGCVLIISPLNRSLRLWGAVLILPVFMNSNTASKSNLQLTVLDVGQGLSIVIEKDERVAVYDVGAKYNDRFDMANAVLIPYLKSIAAPTIDTLILSHRDNDHAGALYELLQQVHVDHLIAGQPDAVEQPSMSYNYLQNCSNKAWFMSGVVYEVRQAPEHLRNSNNNASCMLKITYSDLSILIPGDIEKKVESYWIANDPQWLRADLLVAPHHGSRTSSTADFIKTVNPQLVIFSTGYKNRFRHPNHKVVQRYEQQGVEWLNTAQTGAIQIRLTQSDSLQVTSWREQYSKYWNRQP